MEKQIKKIEDSLKRLYDLHEDHMVSFDKEALPDLEKQSYDREIEVGMLIKSIGKLLELSETRENRDRDSILYSLNDRITLLLEQNKSLTTKVAAYRDTLKKGMKQISKGKKAIHSYRSSQAVSNNPKVISITNY